MRRRRDKFVQIQRPRHKLAGVLLHAAMTVWFALSSVGLPLNLLQGINPQLASCAVQPGQDCRCSIQKKLSGSCCCRQMPTEIDSLAADHSTPTVIARTDSSTPVLHEVSGCCSKRRTVAPASDSTCGVSTSRTADIDLARIASNDRCSCHPDSDSDLQASSFLALPVHYGECCIATVDVVPIVNSYERMPSLRHEPPVPPPRA